jgi:hypothetical protein
MIHLECDNDEALVRGLGIPRGAITHHAGKPRVSKALQESPSSGIVGLVDEDPGSGLPPYLKEFTVVEDRPELRIRRLKHRRDEKWLIVICPDLEPWLYEVAKKAAINPKTHHLPESHRLLHTHAKAHSVRLMEFVASIAASGNTNMVTLRSWLLPRG